MKKRCWWVYLPLVNEPNVRLCVFSPTKVAISPWFGFFDLLAMTCSRLQKLAAGLDDTAVMDIAVREERLLLTEDKDFGRLVYAYSQQSSGVIFIRYPALARRTLPKAITALISSKNASRLERKLHSDEPWACSDRWARTVRGCNSLRMLTALRKR